MIPNPAEAGRLAFVIDEPYIPHVRGGGVADIHEFALGLPKFGWDSAVYCLQPNKIEGTAWDRGARYIRRLPFPYAPTAHDRDLGYPVHRVAALSMVHHTRLPGRDAEVVVLQGARIPQLALRYARLGTKVISAS